MLFTDTHFWSVVVIKYTRCCMYICTKFSLQWRHNEHDGVSNHQPHDCLLNRLFRCRSKKTSNLRVTGLCVGNSPVTGEFPAQRASNAENVSIWWRHHWCVLYYSGYLNNSYRNGVIYCYMHSLYPNVACRYRNEKSELKWYSQPIKVTPWWLICNFILLFWRNHKREPWWFLSLPSSFPLPASCHQEYFWNVIIPWKTEN